MMIRYAPEVRDKLLSEFAASGQSSAAFCRAHGVKEQTFFSWRKRQNEIGIAVPGAVLFRQVLPESGVPVTAASLVLSIGKLQIAVDEQFDPALLRRVVEALS